MPTKRAIAPKPVSHDLEAADATGSDLNDLEAETQTALTSETRIDQEPASLEPPAAPSPAEPKKRVRRLSKLVLSVALVAGLGLGLYVGWPELRERYIQPVETTATDVTALREQLVQIQSQIQALEDERAIANTAAAAQGDAIADLQARTGELMDRNAQIDSAIQSNTAQIGSLTDRIQAVEGSVDQADQVVANEAITMVAAQYLGRARLFLYQANYGLAEQDITSAIEALTQAPPDAQNTQVVERLSSAVDALPDRPVLAADELDIAWSGLLDRSSE